MASRVLRVGPQSSQKDRNCFWERLGGRSHTARGLSLLYRKEGGIEEDGGRVSSTETIFTRSKGFPHSSAEDMSFRAKESRFQLQRWYRPAFHNCQGSRRATFLRSEVEERREVLGRENSEKPDSHDPCL